LYLEQDKNCKTPLDLAKAAGYHDLAEDITEKAAIEVKELPGGKVSKCFCMYNKEMCVCFPFYHIVR